MQRVFLAHSSRDKSSYVGIVAKKLGPYRVIYDDFTFEEGSKISEEIEKGLNKSDIFVLFISDSALESSWVKDELEKAYILLNEGNIKHIFPIIIDKTIEYKDPRIPKWMRDEYNLKLISRPVVATRRIKQKLRQLRWELEPETHEKGNIFVGRNNLINQFEQRIDSLIDPTPTCLIATGIPSIGRRSFLRHCLMKANIVDKAYEPLILSLDSRESIEDFIIKIYDFGISENMEIVDLMKMDIDEKIDISLNIIKDIQNSKEIVFIIDNSCIVNPAGNIAGWFSKILDRIKKEEIITFAVVSRFRINYRYTYKNNEIFTLEIPELDKSERTGLFKRYSELMGLNLSRNDLKHFSDLFDGFPDQIYYTCYLIEKFGLSEAKKDTISIVNFSSDKISPLLNRYENDENAFNLINFLSKFDFISYEFIFEIIEENDEIKNLLNELFYSAILERLGGNNEYIRMNDTIKNYLMRTNKKLPEIYEKRLKEHLENFLIDYESEEKDASDLLYSIKENLKSGLEINEKFIIPSHILKIMIEYYHSGSYEHVLDFSERILENEDFLDSDIIRSVKYYRCLSLARMRDRKLLNEVQFFSGTDHYFLLGFYYRLIGNNAKALEKYYEALKGQPNSIKIKREKMIVYNNSGQPEKAFDLAKELYSTNKKNPFIIQGYFFSLINSEINKENELKLLELLDNLEKIKSDLAREMFLRAYAHYLAVYKKDEFEAISFANKAVNEFPNKIYPLLTKFDISNRFNRMEDMESILNDLEKMIKKKRSYYNNFIICKATFMAKEGNRDGALELIKNEIKFLPEGAKEKILERIEKIYKITK